MTALPATPNTIDTFARTIWGEARGCGIVGMAHVASVIINRTNRPSWWGKSIASVCIAPQQFSCRNAGDPNLMKLLTVTTEDSQFSSAMAIATIAADGLLIDRTGGADSYYASSLATPPYWAIGLQPTMQDGWHIFYRTQANVTPVAPLASA